MIIDIIVPVYNEEESIHLFWTTAQKYLYHTEGVNYRILFVNDGSSDKTLERIKDLTRNHEEIGYISFTRNYGKEAAMLAGLKASKGDYTMFMDVDLQDPPELIPKLYKELVSKNCEAVFTRRIPRKQNITFGERCASVFYNITKTPKGLRDYCIFSKEVRNNVLSMTESQRFTRFLLLYVTPSSSPVISFEYKEREKGETKWNLFKLTNYAFNGILCKCPEDILDYNSLFIGYLSIFYICSLFLRFLKHFIDFAFSAYLLIAITLILHYLYTIHINTRKRPAYFIHEVGGWVDEEEYKVQ